MRKILTQQRVRELFDYSDGNLIVRKVRPTQRVRVGAISGCNSHGYIVTKISNNNYFNHRLIWLWHYGYMPENQIDHIDRNPANNKIENLREVSPSCNVRNCGISVKNKSGVKGVCWDKQAGKWQASICANGLRTNIGVYSDKVDAIAARLMAEQCLGWSDCDDSSSASKYMAKYIGEVTT